MTIEQHALLVPEWARTGAVGAFMSLRQGGISDAPYGGAPLSGAAAGKGLNLGDHVGDAPAAVARNRAIISRLLPAQPVWLDQMHGTAVALPVAQGHHPEPVQADAAVTASRGLPLVVMTADCLPVLFADHGAGVVGAAHAGWRGLAAGVLENTVDAMLRKGARAPQIKVWLGAAIGPDAFETGNDVRAAFMHNHATDAQAFRPRPGHPGKWLGDLYELARRRLRRQGVSEITGGQYCTVNDQRFYSFRRDRITGRMGCFIWLR